MRPVIAALALLLLLPACGSPESRAAGERGVAEAERDIAAGAPSLLYIGRPHHEASPLDPETGLPRYSCGCEVSDESMAYTDAYNRRIREALESGELEGLTYAHKFTTGDAVRARFEAEGGRELAYGTEPVEAPGGRYAVLLAERAPAQDTPYVFVLDRETGDRRELHFVGEPRARVLFDHAGTTLLLRDDRFERCMTLDIPRGIVLQMFADPGRGW